MRPGQKFGHRNHTSERAAKEVRPFYSLMKQYAKIQPVEEQIYLLVGEKGDAVGVELACDSKYTRCKTDSVDVLAKEAKAAVDEAAQRKVEAQWECHSVERGGSFVLEDENHSVEQGRSFVLEDESHIHPSSSESGARG